MLVKIQSNYNADKVEPENHENISDIPVSPLAEKKEQGNAYTRRCGTRRNIKGGDFLYITGRFL